jgi:dihydrofolate reductase
MEGLVRRRAAIPRSRLVLTHHAHTPTEIEGGTTFHFVTEGPEAAHERAREVAGSRDINIGGGASTAQQYLRLGLVDEMEIHVVPALLGAGERLFENLDGPPAYRTPLEILSSPRAAHFHFVRDQYVPSELVVVAATLSSWYYRNDSTVAREGTGVSTIRSKDASTIAYDRHGERTPRPNSSRCARLPLRHLVLGGTQTPWMARGAPALTDADHWTLERQQHGVEPDVIAAVLIAFLARRGGR